MSWPGAHRYVLRAALPALILMVAACGSGPGPSAHPATARATPGPVTRSFARNHFTVTFSALALEKASASGVNLPAAVASALARISALLPGPKGTRWSAITATALDALLAGSHYQPCPS
jgi:hypothetical protein